jgi:aldehyde dehydrogenase (NAD+)
VFNLVIGADPDVARAMVADPRLPLISFTGSTRVGREVAQVVAGRLGRTILELGGNNAVLVEPDCDVDLVVRAVVFGAVGTAGQRCTTTRRLLVHRGLTDELLTKLTQAYRQVRIGDPLDAQTLMGPLISAAAAERYENVIAAARQQGGEVVVGGRRLKHLPGFFVEPTIIRMPGMTAQVREEAFAPILYLLEYDDLDQAIAMHNDVPQGLSSALFTSSLFAAERFLSVAGSDCGIANVNLGTSGAEIGGAFGGEKETGGGRESGSDAWKAYMRRQTNTINWSNQLPLAQGIEFGT